MLTFKLVSQYNYPSLVISPRYPNLPGCHIQPARTVGVIENSESADRLQYYRVNRIVPHLLLDTVRLCSFAATIKTSTRQTSVRIRHVASVRPSAGDVQGTVCSKKQP